MPGGPEGRLFGAIVVGAGPSGLALAARLGRHIDVALVERRHVGWPKPCGGLLCEEAYGELMSLGLPDGSCGRAERVEVEVFMGEDALPLQSFRMVDRRALALGLRATLPPSVRLFEGGSCALRRRGAGFVAELRPADARGRGGGAIEVEARRLVAADGALSSARRFLGIEGVPALGLVQRFFPGRPARGYMVIDPAVCPRYYYWLLPREGGFVLGSVGEAAVAGRCLEDAQRRFPEAFEGGLRPLGEERCAISRPRGVEDLVHYRDGGFLVGEAAGLVRPSSGEGLTSALASARVLGEVIAGESIGREPGSVEAEGRAYEDAMRARVAEIAGS